MLKQLMMVCAAGFVLTACDQSKVNCEGGCDGPIIFKECVRDTVYFDFDKSKLTAAAQEIVTEQAKWMTENECAKAVIAGHTDQRGTAAYNMALGKRRADAVQNGLTSQGVDGERLSTVSYGKSQATGNHPMDRKAVTHIDEDGIPETKY